jgi:hypothetical protein
MRNQMSRKRPVSVPYVSPFKFSVRRTEVLTVTQMPTFVIYKNGDKIKDLVGANQAGLQVRPLVDCLRRSHSPKNYEDTCCRGGELCINTILAPGTRCLLAFGLTSVCCWLLRRTRCARVPACQKTSVCVRPFVSSIAF